MPQKIPISVIVTTRNEEANIERCLRSVQNFAEIFVLDSLSVDRTVEIAESHGAKVVEWRWNGRYPLKRQWSLDNLPLKYDWVLFPDADEEVTPEVAQEIREIIDRGPDAAGYFIGYDYAFQGKILRHGHRVYKLVFFDRTRARWLDYQDHDRANASDIEVHYHPQVDGKVGTLKHRMIHRDHRSMYHFFDRHNAYSDWEAVTRNRQSLRAGRQANRTIIKYMRRVYERLPFRPVIVFVYFYVVRLGLLDGRPGFNYALAKAFYYWQIELKAAELRQTLSD